MAAKRASMKTDLADKIRRQQKAYERGRKWYGIADALLEEIIKEMAPGDQVSLGKGKRAMLKDTAAGKSKIGHFVYARRYEIEMVNA